MRNADIEAAAREAFAVAFKSNVKAANVLFNDSLVDGELADVEQAAWDACRAALARPAGDAGAMRERAARLLDDEVERLKAAAEQVRSGDGRYVFQHYATRFASKAAAIRALPLPPATAVEEARGAVIDAAKAQREAAVAAFHARGAERSRLEAVWDGTTNVTQDAVARLLAAEAAAKGGARG